MPIVALGTLVLALACVGDGQSRLRLVGQIVTASSCEEGPVQDAITAAPNNWTVQVPAGSCEWTSAVIIPNTKGITLRGAGIGNTIITTTLTADFPLSVEIGTSYFTRVTGFTFDSAGITFAAGYSFVVINGTGSMTGPQFRFDHNALPNIRRRGLILYAYTNSVLYGLVDANTFGCPYVDSCQSISVYGGPPAADSTMYNFPVEFGTAKFIIAEDNTFTFTSPNDSFMEGYAGARYVIRFTAIHGTTFGSHGADSSDGRGTMAYEYYENDTDVAGCTSSCTGIGQARLRSGTGFIFNSTWTSGYAAILLDNYRSDPAFGPVAYLGTYCNGSNAWDNNTEGGSRGRHCLDQIGTIFGPTQNGVHTHVPFYIFNNPYTGIYGDGTYSMADVGNSVDADLDIIENADYYNHDQTFDGTTGVGVGTAATLAGITTCTTGVAFWVTNEGEWNSLNGATADGRLYKCTATNTWTLHYTPYTYPHPLAATP